MSFFDDDRWSWKCDDKACGIGGYTRGEVAERNAHYRALMHVHRMHPKETRPHSARVLLNGRIDHRVTAEPIPAPEDDPPPF